jgi:hypothetical protein
MRPRKARPACTLPERRNTYATPNTSDGKDNDDHNNNDSSQEIEMDDDDSQSTSFPNGRLNLEESSLLAQPENHSESPIDTILPPTTTPGCDSTLTQESGQPQAPTHTQHHIAPLNPQYRSIDAKYSQYRRHFQYEFDTTRLLFLNIVRFNSLNLKPKILRINSSPNQPHISHPHRLATIALSKSELEQDQLQDLKHSHGVKVVVVNCTTIKLHTSKRDVHTL